jgi:hypothetical protein
MCNLYTARVTAAEIAQAFQAVEPRARRAAR